jgi:type IV pilus assembly protein PilA
VWHGTTNLPSRTSYDVKRMLTLPVQISRSLRPGQVTRRTLREAGFSLIELLIVVAIILVLLGIMLPQVNKIRENGNETRAVAEVRTLNLAQTQYSSQFGRFANSLAELGPATGAGSEGPSASGLIPTDLAKGVSNGYNFTLTGNGAAYTISAVPVAFGSTGRRTFYSDQSGVIHQNWGAEPATAQSDQFK